VRLAFSTAADSKVLSKPPLVDTRKIEVGKMMGEIEFEDTGEVMEIQQMLCEPGELPEDAEYRGHDTCSRYRLTSANFRGNMK
jgi:hypothetical protein